MTRNEGINTCEIPDQEFTIFHGNMLKPSGCLPSDLHNPCGSLVAAIPLAVQALINKNEFSDNLFRFTHNTVELKSIAATDGMKYPNFGIIIFRRRK